MVSKKAMTHIPSAKPLRFSLYLRDPYFETQMRGPHSCNSCCEVDDAWRWRRH